MSPSGKKTTMSPARSIVGGFALGTLLGTVMWAIEPVWMHWRALPYLGTPLVTVLLVYALAGTVVGAVGGVIGAAAGRSRPRMGRGASVGFTGWVLTSLLVARRVGDGSGTGSSAGVIIGLIAALAAWIAISFVVARAGGGRGGRATWVAGAMAVLYLLVLAAWNPVFYYRLPSKNGPADAPNVVMIVVDALRADHLGAYGYDRDTSPNVDRLAADGFVFERAYSHGNRTIFAMPALFTSMYPSINGAVGYQTSMVPLAADRTTIAEMLSERGYATAGMMSNIYLKSAFGMTQGFDRTEQFNSTRFSFSIYRMLSFLGLAEKPDHARSGSPRADVVTDAAIRWLERFDDGDPFFLFVHYMDVHHEYAPPPEYEEMFQSSPEAAAIDGHELFKKTRDLLAEPPPIEFGGAELARLIDLYDACIRATDDQIGRLIDAVEARGGDRETVYVFTSDHGDEFMEHGSLYHVNLAHEELLRIPLIVKSPAQGGGVRVPGMARHIDVLPTLGELAGAEVPDSAMGQSLVPLMDGRASEGARITFAEGDFCTAMIYDNWKIMYEDTSDTYYLYDLGSDPGGLVNVAGDHPEVVAQLGPLVAEYVAAAAARRQTQGREATSETIRQLRALGYVN